MTPEVRELASMQIAGEKLRVMEKEFDISETSEFLDTVNPDEGVMPTRGVNVVGKWLEWAAFTGESEMASWAALFPMVGSDSVILWAAVKPKFRGIGLGKLMIRLATDQAIRYRKRMIIVEVKNDNAPALQILDAEDFEKQPEVRAGFTLLKKELKWV